MQATSYYEQEQERLRIEGFQCGPGEREQERMKKRMEERAKELERQGEKKVCAVTFDRKKKTDPKRHRRAKLSR
jgi:hypothetical protein